MCVLWFLCRMPTCVWSGSWEKRLTGWRACCSALKWYVDLLSLEHRVISLRVCPPKKSSSILRFCIKDIPFYVFNPWSGKDWSALYHAWHFPSLLFFTTDHFYTPLDWQQRNPSPSLSDERDGNLSDIVLQNELKVTRGRHRRLHLPDKCSSHWHIKPVL